MLRAPNRVQFFSISTSKSAPGRRCFVHFHFQTGFAPFALPTELRATAACTFSTSQLPKVCRACGGLRLLTSKCASRHNCVQLFISHLASWLRTRGFSEPTFRSCRATNHWKNTVFRDFPTFSRACIFSFSAYYPSLIFSMSELLPGCSAFPSVHV